jgi:hypothetical protein
MACWYYQVVGIVNCVCMLYSSVIDKQRLALQMLACVLQDSTLLAHRVYLCMTDGLLMSIPSSLAWRVNVTMLNLPRSVHTQLAVLYQYSSHIIG